jgi:prefoldin subunit 5
MRCAIPRSAIAVAVLVVGVSAFLAPTATAAPTPEVKALQRQVKTLTAQVTSLRSQLNALKATVGEVATKADAANTAATTAGQNATAAVTKTNCLVNATPLSQWSNDVYADGNSLFMDTGLSFSAASDPVSAYVAGINSSCVPSVFARGRVASFTAHSRISEGALLSPH